MPAPRDGLGEGEIRVMLQDMVAQRRQEIVRCEACARVDRAEQEAEEIGIIEQFLPARMSEQEIGGAVAGGDRRPSAPPGSRTPAR